MIPSPGTVVLPESGAPGGDLRSIARSSVVVSACAVLSAGFGFLVSVLMARVYGASAAMDSYLTGSALPLTLSGALLTCFGYVLIPCLSAAGDKRQVLADIFPVLLAIVAAAVGVGVLASPALVGWAAPHLSLAKHASSVAVARVFWLAAGVSCLGSFFAAILQERKQFAGPAAAGLLVRAGMLAVLLLAAAPDVVLLAWGYLAGTVAQAGVLGWPLRTVLAWNWPRWRASSRRFFRQMVPVLLSILPSTLVPMMDAYWAARLPDGSLSFAGYDYRLVVTAVSVLVNGVSAVIFPFLCDHAHGRGESQFRRLLLLSLGCELALIGPAVVAAVAWRQGLVRVLFERGAFTHESTLAVAAMVPAYMAGMLGMATWVVVSRAFYARGWYASMGALGVTFSLAYFLLEGWLVGRVGYLSMGDAFALCWVAAAAGSLYLLWWKLPAAGSSAPVEAL